MSQQNRGVNSQEKRVRKGSRFGSDHVYTPKQRVKVNEKKARDRGRESFTEAVSEAKLK